MKKMFLIFALTTLVNIGANAEVNQSDIAIFRDREWTNGVEDKEYENNIPQQSSVSTSAAQNKLADSFMAAFGMKVEASGQTGQGAPGMSAGSTGTMAVGMSTISTTSTNQVTPPFTPYSYQK